MKIKEKVRWIVKSKGLEINNFFSKNRLKDIKKVLKKLDENSFIYGVKECNINDFNNFLDLYKTEIGKKTNAKVHNLYERYKDEIGKKGILYFLYIKDLKNNLIAGGIGIKRDNYFIFGYKASNLDYDFGFKLKVGIGNILDYFLFKTGIEELKSDFISFGKDRNAYGILGAKASLAMTKMPLGLRTYDFEGNNDIDIDLENIKNDSIIFYNPDKNTKKFQSALLYVNSELSEERINILYSTLINSELDVSIKKY